MNTCVIMLSRLGEIAPTLQIIIRIRWENSCKISSKMPSIGVHSIKMVAIVLIRLIKAVHLLFSQIAPVQALDLVDGFWCVSHSCSHL